MTRAKFTDHGIDGVTVTYVDDCDIQQSRTFFARAGYVWEILRGGREQQVCARLQARGNTVMIGGQQQLIDIIRREYRAMRAAEKRAAASAY